MKSTLFAVDLSKSVFEVAVSHHPGRVAKRYALSRRKFAEFMGQQSPSVVVMEACGTSHYWARRLQRQGHEVRILPAHHVARYRRGSKTDQADAKALLEAARNEEIRPLPVKSIDGQTLTALHRFRSRWVASRTARLNTIRGILREFGLFIPVGAHHVRPHVRQWLAEEELIPRPLRPILEKACEEVGNLEEQIRLVEAQLRCLARNSALVERLQTIPGVGLLGATALVGLVGDAHRFPSGRHFASYLGLTPREHSSGGTRHLGRITKHGDRYLRTLLIHGARSVLLYAQRQEKRDPLREWAVALRQRTRYSVTVVALANRLARIVWAVWVREQKFQSRTAQEVAPKAEMHPESN